jgi:hypothetical protein
MVFTSKVSLEALNLLKREKKVNPVVSIQFTVYGLMFFHFK